MSYIYIFRKGLIISTRIFKVYSAPGRTFSKAARKIIPIEKTNNQSFDHNLRIHNTLK